MTGRVYRVALIDYLCSHFNTHVSKLGEILEHASIAKDACALFKSATLLTTHMGCRNRPLECIASLWGAAERQRAFRNNYLSITVEQALMCRFNTMLLHPYLPCVGEYHGPLKEIEFFPLECLNISFEE